MTSFFSGCSTAAPPPGGAVDLHFLSMQGIQLPVSGWFWVLHLDLSHLFLQTASVIGVFVIHYNDDEK